MSKNAATEDALGTLHEVIATKLKELIEDENTTVQGVKMAIDFLHKNSITCVKNEIESVGDLDRALQRRTRRFGTIDTPDINITDIATARAKKAMEG